MKVNGKELKNDRIAISLDIRKAYDAVYALKYEYLDEDNIDTERVRRAILALNDIIEKVNKEE